MHSAASEASAKEVLPEPPVQKLAKAKPRKQVARSLHRVHRCLRAISELFESAFSPFRSLEVLLPVDFSEELLERLYKSLLARTRGKGQGPCRSDCTEAPGSSKLSEDAFSQMMRSYYKAQLGACSALLSSHLVVFFARW